jgi:hypothetical protein
LTNERVEERDGAAVRDLLKDLANLRELDRRLAVLTPGSDAYDAATAACDALSTHVMDRFRDERARSKSEPTSGRG